MSEPSKSNQLKAEGLDQLLHAYQQSRPHLLAIQDHLKEEAGQNETEDGLCFTCQLPVCPHSYDNGAEEDREITKSDENFTPFRGVCETPVELDYPLGHFSDIDVSDSENGEISPSSFDILSLSGDENLTKKETVTETVLPDSKPSEPKKCCQMPA